MQPKDRWPLCPQHTQLPHIPHLTITTPTSFTALLSVRSPPGRFAPPFSPSCSILHLAVLNLIWFMWAQLLSQSGLFWLLFLPSIVSNAALGLASSTDC